MATVKMGNVAAVVDTAAITKEPKITMKWIVTKDGNPLDDSRGEPHDTREEALESLLEIFRELQCEDCGECDVCESRAECMNEQADIRNAMGWKRLDDCLPHCNGEYKVEELKREETP